MRAKALLALLLTLGAPAAGAMEGEQRGHFDLYYAPRTDFTSTAPGTRMDTDGGMGYGFQGRLFFQARTFASLEAYTDRYDGVNGDGFRVNLTWIRLGGGYEVLPGVDIRAQFIRGQSDFEADNGFAVHANAQTGVHTWWELTGRVGWVSLRDTGDGIEWLAGAAIAINGPLRLFVEHREATLEAGAETRIVDTMAGVRVRF